MAVAYTAMMSVIFVFLDGIGLAPAGPDNPLTAAVMPTFQQLYGGPLTLEYAGRSEERLLLRAIDATLGVPGLPQSGTGQTALLTGVNAAALHGRHQPHFPPVALRPVLAEQSIFRRVIAHGGRATFANAFGDGYWEALAARRIRRSASVIAAQGAELRFRDLDDLQRGEALAWDITGTLMRGRPEYWAPVTPEIAGANLARLGLGHELVFFECFLPDLAGHGRLDDQHEAAAVVPQIETVMALIDGLVSGVLAALRPDDTLLITSDHGNIESLAAPAHTRNPVPLLVVGAHVDAFTAVSDITGIADAIERAATG